ncbi:MAG TPA: TRAP transporter small permease [Phycisphaerae bacterium]|nr:TRAP transporter small permease [Phycisphaerae bacterium]HRY66424.1 TRAP transporter small permease [Phycisphaerae bacterium]HSA25868.1 TRAP transporter small permease [Phycisphaerae bacterium]
MAWLDKLTLVVNRVLIVLGGVAVLLLMGVATTNVVMRLFGGNLEGAYELVGFAGAVAVACALGATQRRKDHIVVDIISRSYPPVVAKLVDGLQYLVTLVFFAIIAYQVFRHAMALRENGEVSETLKIIYYPFVVCVAAGCAAMVLNLAVDLTHLFGRPRPRVAS